MNVHLLEMRYEPAFAAALHGLFILGGLLLYVLTTRAGRQRRHPSAALAWVMAMLVLPYMAVPLFLLLGKRKLAAPTATPALPAPAADDAAPHWAGALLAGMGVAPTAYSEDVRFHADGIAAEQALMDIIGAARHRILLATFILADDRIGNAVVDALAWRARSGVVVHVLLDSLSGLRCSRRQLDKLRGAGIAVRWANARRRDRLETRLNLRYHRKMLLCDEAILWCGGRNVADEYFTHDGAGPPWVDLSVDVRGALAAQVAALFERDWRQAGGEALRLAPAGAARGAIPAQLVASGPEYADEQVYAVLLAGAFEARERIVAVTPYFVPDDALLVAWHMACRRGVRLTLVLPARSNHRLADWARGRALRDLAAAGASIFLYPGMIHAKALVIDEAVALCGSANLDSRSLFLNFEMMLAFYGKAEIAWLAGWIEARAAESAPFSAREPSLPVDLAEGVVRVLGFQL